MGRWSRLIAAEFIQGLESGPGLKWLDVGCGTGALLEALLETTTPARIVGVDPSPEFAATAQARLAGPVEIRTADGEELPFADGAFDVVVSGLALNFIPDQRAALAEWKRVARPGGSINVYVWDYAEGMEFLRYFWDAVVELDPDAAHLAEGNRFPICRPAPLIDLFESTGLESVTAGSIEVATRFSDFADYWDPFLRGQGPAPAYVASLTESHQSRLEDHLRGSLPTSDSHIDLSAKAWTVSGWV